MPAYAYLVYNVLILAASWEQGFNYKGYDFSAANMEI
jgi:hypothetical protein